MRSPGPRQAERWWARLRRRLVRAGAAGPSEFLRAAYLAPRQVLLVTVGSGDDEALWPVDWHTPVSLEPPRYALAYASTSHGAEVLARRQEFVLNFMRAEDEALVLAAGTLTGRDGNKRERLGLEALPSRFLGSNRLGRAAGWVECRVEQTLALDDRCLAVGRVVHAETSPVRSLFHEWVP